MPQFLVRYPLETAARACGIGGPIALYQGELIPLRHSERLVVAFSNARLTVVAGARHSDIQKFPAYKQHSMNALRSL